MSSNATEVQKLIGKLILSSGTDEKIPNLERVHSNEKKEIDKVMTGLDEIMALIEKIQPSGGKTLAYGKIHGMKGAKMADFIKTVGRRGANKEEKDKLVEWIKTYYGKNENLKVQVFASLIKYAKVMSINFGKNKAILENAIELSKKAGFEPIFFAQKMREFVTDFKEVIFPIMEAASKDGHDLKFFTWGALCEPFKADFAASFNNVAKEAGSLAYYYSKVSGYGKTIDELAAFSKRVIQCVCVIVAYAIHEKVIGADFMKGKVTNDTVKSAIEKSGKLQALRAEAADIAALTVEAYKYDTVPSVHAACQLASGISPNYPMQSFEYKMMSTQVDVNGIKKTFKSVAFNFALIKTVFNKLTGEKRLYTTLKFGEALSQCYEMWRPMFVVARVLRSYIFPQLTLVNNSEINMSEFVSAENLNMEINLEGILA